jgi:hypothetical protein
LVSHTQVQQPPLQAQLAQFLLQTQLQPLASMFLLLLQLAQRHLQTSQQSTQLSRLHKVS